MRNSIKVLVAIALSGALAACSNNTAEISKMSVKGGAYEKGLHKGYLKLAKDEHKEDDWGDAHKFEDRAKMAAMGKPTAPEMLSARNIPKKHLKALGDGYWRLNAALAKGGAQKAGMHAAAAQTSFDCWMQEAEENLQKKHIEACRNKFYGDMALFEGAVYASPVKVAKKKAKKARKPQTTQYVIYFDFNSARLNKAGKSAIAFMKGDIKPKGKVSMAGFADRSGSPEYNDYLAIKRVTAVLNALKEAGVKNEIRTTIHGEARNAIATKDGARQRLNRRVEIYVKQ